MCPPHPEAGKEQEKHRVKGLQGTQRAGPTVRGPTPPRGRRQQNRRASASCSTSQAHQQPGGRLAEKQLSMAPSFQTHSGIIHYHPTGTESQLPSQQRCLSVPEDEPRGGGHSPNPTARSHGASPTTRGLASIPNQLQHRFHPLLPYFFLISSCLDFISALLKNKEISFSTNRQCSLKRCTFYSLEQRGCGFTFVPRTRAGRDELGHQATLPSGQAG